MIILSVPYEAAYGGRMEWSGIRGNDTRGICVPSSGKENTSSTRTVKQECAEGSSAYVSEQQSVPALRFFCSTISLELLSAGEDVTGQRDSQLGAG